jgi:hypothetical protein
MPFSFVQVQDLLARQEPNQVVPLKRLDSNDRFLCFTANIRLVWCDFSDKCVSLQRYGITYEREKFFIVQVRLSQRSQSAIFNCRKPKYFKGQAFNSRIGRFTTKHFKHMAVLRPFLQLKIFARFCRVCSSLSAYCVWQC